MADYKKHARLPGKLVFVGFGSVGQGSLPLLLRHLDIRNDGVLIINADDRGAAEAAAYGIPYRIDPLTPQNFRELLDRVLEPGDFLLNVSVDVSSTDLIGYCLERDVMYLDTCIEPWLGGYTDAAVPPGHRTNYALREKARALNAKHPKGATAVVTHGANPGLISHFVKQALLNLARDLRVETRVPVTREGWALLAERVGMKVVHVAERDTQYAIPQKRPHEFVNTWSVDGFAGEGVQPSELGWGSHERHFPADGVQYDFGPRCSIFLNRPGVSVRVRSWTPLNGPYHGFLITHGESVSIADYFTVRDGDRVRFRPTVHYAYHPCDGAVLSIHELCGRNHRVQPQQRILMDDIQGGIDELGVLLMGHERGGYWFGSQLSVEQARELAPYNNATSLQVAAGVLGAIVWACENPRAGVVDPDEIDFARVLEVARPYLGNLVGVYTDWTPLQDRGVMFPEDVDASDPWQFKNFRVT
ncbi:MAG: homospermidine synthase [Betaproteobacteria bacterium]|nr:MAG: homospermidine synthase [Betaproteobacteria bacterium]